MRKKYEERTVTGHLMKTNENAYDMISRPGHYIDHRSDMNKFLDNEIANSYERRRQAYMNANNDASREMESIAIYDTK